MTLEEKRQIQERNGIPLPSMTTASVHTYLAEIGRNWQGKGIAMELGVWMGASSAALLRGLKHANYGGPYYAFDEFQVYPVHSERLLEKNGIRLPVGYDTEKRVGDALKRIYPYVQTVKGWFPDTLTKAHVNRPIEICLFDGPKKEPVFSGCMKIIAPWLVKGAILGLLDYNYYRTFPEGSEQYNNLLAPVRFMEKNPDVFELMQDWPNTSPAFFRYKGGKINV